MRTPRDVLVAWVQAFNDRDADALAGLYHPDAANHQVAAGDPVVGRERIVEDARTYFRAFPDSYTRVENLFVDGEWAVLEWAGGGTWRGPFAGHEPNGRTFTLRGCGFFRVADGRIVFQRGYWDKAAWFGQLGLSVT